MEIIIDTLPKGRLKENQFIAFDIEIWGLQEGKLHRPNHGKFACLSMCYEPGKVYVYTHIRYLKPLFEWAEKGVWVFHNAKFDIGHLRRGWVPVPIRTKLWDSLIIEQILWSGFHTGFGLQDLCRRYLDYYMVKETRLEFAQEQSELTRQQIEYAAIDAEKTLLVALAQRKRITKKEFGVWKNVDLPALWAFLDFQGFAVDEQGWKDLAKRNKQRQLEIDKELPINPRSYKVVKEYLQERGFKGLRSTGQDVLTDYMARYPDTEATEIAEQVILSRTYSKRASTYGEKMLKTYLEYEFDHVGVFHADWKITGTETGRPTSANPCINNIPIRDTKDFRELFTHRPGYKLVVVDVSQQEPRIAAYLSQDKKLIKAFQSGGDVYLATSEQIKNVSGKDISRTDTKAIFLGLGYGLSDMGLASVLGITQDEASNLIQVFFKSFPGMADYIQTRQSVFPDYVETVLGRRHWLNPYDYQWERNALNSPIQGTAADQLKMALGKMRSQWNFNHPFPLVAQIYDEVIADVHRDIAEEVAEFIRDTLVSTAEDMCPGIPFAADVSIVDNWAEAK